MLFEKGGERGGIVGAAVGGGVEQYRWGVAVCEGRFGVDVGAEDFCGVSKGVDVEEDIAQAVKCVSLCCISLGIKWAPNVLLGLDEQDSRVWEELPIAFRVLGHVLRRRAHPRAEDDQVRLLLLVLQRRRGVVTAVWWPVD